MGKTYIKEENGEKVLYEEGAIMDTRLGELKQAGMFNNGEYETRNFLGPNYTVKEDIPVIDINPRHDMRVESSEGNSGTLSYNYWNKRTEGTLERKVQDKIIASNDDSRHNESSSSNEGYDGMSSSPSYRERRDHDSQQSFSWSTVYAIAGALAEFFGSEKISRKVHESTIEAYVCEGDFPNAACLAERIGHIDDAIRYYSLAKMTEQAVELATRHGKKDQAITLMSGERRYLDAARYADASGDTERALGLYWQGSAYEANGYGRMDALEEGERIARERGLARWQKQFIDGAQRFLDDEEFMTRTRAAELAKRKVSRGKRGSRA